MLILGIETSSPRVSLSLWDQKKACEIAREEFETDRAHNAVIFEPTKKLLEVSEDQLAGICIGLGPGSYSGVRVGIAVGNGLSLACGVPVAGVPSLQAFSTLENFFVVGDARRRTRFVATIRERKLVGEPELIPEQDFAARVDSLEHPCFSCDKSVVAEHENIGSAYPDAATIAASFSEPGSQLLEPIYLRPPYITKAKPKGLAARKKG